MTSSAGYQWGKYTPDENIFAMDRMKILWWIHEPTKIIQRRTISSTILLWVPSTDLKSLLGFSGFLKNLFVSLMKQSENPSEFYLRCQKPFVSFMNRFYNSLAAHKPIQKFFRVQKEI